MRIWLGPALTQLVTYAEQDSKMWTRLLFAQDNILNDFKDWWQNYAKQQLWQAAIPIRRGDHLYFNKDRRMWQSKSYQERRRIEWQWQDADNKTMAWIKDQLSYGRTTHIITDDQDYRD